jgi:hypothetical protein
MNDERARYLESGSGAEPPDRERLDGLRDILSGDPVWSDPPPEVVGQVTTEIAAGARPNVRRRPAWLGVAVVLSALLVAVLAAAVGLFSEDRTSTVAMSGTELQTTARGEALIRTTGAGWWIRLELDGLPPAPEGSYYEGWMWNEGGHGVSLGTFHFHSDDEPVILWSGVDPAVYPSIWITLEAEDGDPAASQRVVMRGRIEG